MALDVIASGASALNLDLRRDEVALQLARAPVFVPAQYVEREPPVLHRRRHDASVKHALALRARSVEVRGELPRARVARVARLRRGGVVRAADSKPPDHGVPRHTRRPRATAQRSADEASAANHGGYFGSERQGAWISHGPPAFARGARSSA